MVELLITITIIAILVATIVIIVNPGEIFKRTRDARRMADLAALQNFAIVYISHVPFVDLDGSNLATCSDETNRTVYVSIPSNQTAPSPPTGWNVKQVSEETLGRFDGTGWVPINMAAIPLGEPFGRLPTDPLNIADGANKFFYSYGCKRTGAFEFNARLESKELGPGGTNDISMRDGGDVLGIYEVGLPVGVLPVNLY